MQMVNSENGEVDEQGYYGGSGSHAQLAGGVRVL